MIEIYQSFGDILDDSDNIIYLFKYIYEIICECAITEMSDEIKDIFIQYIIKQFLTLSKIFDKLFMIIL